jgi:hypothetical protein
MRYLGSVRTNRAWEREEWEKRPFKSLPRATQSRPAPSEEAVPRVYCFSWVQQAQRWP